jgi:hypothetical protein
MGMGDSKTGPDWAFSFIPAVLVQCRIVASGIERAVEEAFRISPILRNMKVPIQ